MAETSSRIHVYTEQRFACPGLFASVLQALARMAPSMLEPSEEVSSRLDDASSRVP